MTSMCSEDFASPSKLRQAILDLTPDGMLVIDRAGHIRFSNPACTHLLEYSADELSRMDFSAVVVDGYRRSARTAFENTLQGQTKSTVLTVKAKSGQCFRVTVQTVPYVVEGAIQGVVAIAQNHDRLRAVEKALGTSERSLRLVMELAQVSSWRWNAIDQTIDPSPELFQVMGIDPSSSSTITADTLLDPIDPEDRIEVERSLTRAIEERIQVSVQFRVHTEDGSTKVFLAMSDPQFGPMGEFQGLIGMVQDITEIHRLSESQQQLAAIFERSQDLVMVIDLDGTFRYLNRTARLTLGILEHENAERLNIKDLHDPHESGAVLEHLTETIAKDSWQGEVWLRHRDGHAIPVSGALQCHRDSHGRPRFLCGVARDITHEKALQEHIRYQADHDTLTGLLSRGRFTELLAEHLLAVRDTNEVTIGFMDLNDFKQINDVVGHNTGDLLLAEVARRLSRHFAEANVLARWGGDEFTFWLPNSGAAEATEWLKCLARDLERPYHVNDQDFECIPALGLSVFPTDGADVETLVRKADAAMFEAKRRNVSFMFHTESLSSKSDRRTKTREELRTALRNHELVAYFQPVVEAQHHHLVAVEALVRWLHPKAGILAPAEFIAEAERSALIIPIGLNVLRMVGTAAQTWRAQGFPPIRVAINFSARQLAEDELASTVYRICQETGLDPLRVDCEITETAILENHELARRTLDQLRSYGFHILLDDFGTGYSSLSHLRDLPIDGIKLDRSFVERLPSHPRESAIARATIRLAHDLNLTVTAEGVETAEQAAFLSGHGCDQLQGYGISRPLASEAFLNWRTQYRPGPI